MAKFEPAKLFDLLERQIEVSGDLITILDEELAAVISVDINNLMTVSRKKQQQLTRLLTLDNTICDVVESVQNKNTPPKSPAESQRTIRISDLVNQLPKEQGQRLAHLRDEIIRRRQQIETKNSTSKRLIKETLGYLDDAIGLITGKLSEKQYRYSGKFKEAKVRPSVFISRNV